MLLVSHSSTLSTENEQECCKQGAVEQAGLSTNTRRERAEYNIQLPCTAKKEAQKLKNNSLLQSTDSCYN